MKLRCSARNRYKHETFANIAHDAICHRYDRSPKAPHMRNGDEP